MKAQLGIFLGLAAAAGVAVGRSDAATLYSIEDVHVSNDNSGAGGGPNAVSNGNQFFEVRNLFTAPSTIRKKIGYVKFDITSIPSSAYATTTIAFSFRNDRDGAGPIRVYGLIDNAPNADSTFTEANWYSYKDAGGVPAVFSGVPAGLASGMTYSKGLGVDVTVPSTDTTGNLGIDPAEATLLGVMNIPAGGANDFQSNTTDLPLGAFLAADTNGFVTFMFADTRNGNPSTEWRVITREDPVAANSATSTRLIFLVPEPTGMTLLVFGGLLGLVARRK